MIESRRKLMWLFHLGAKFMELKPRVSKFIEETKDFFLLNERKISIETEGLSSSSRRKAHIMN